MRAFVTRFNSTYVGELQLTTEERLEREEDGLHTINGGPLVLCVCQNVVPVMRVRETAHLENVQTDRTTSQVNIRVVARSIELDRWCSVRVVWREGDGNLEAQASVNLAREVNGNFRRAWNSTYSGGSTFNRSGPLEEIGIGFWEGRLVVARQYECNWACSSSSRFQGKRTSKKFN